jgi:hypothetical protein
MNCAVEAAGSPWPDQATGQTAKSSTPTAASPDQSPPGYKEHDIADRIRAEFLTRIGLEDLLHPPRPGALNRVSR